jgi:predicted TIM-barrel fold metal-dependent hydrolase
MFGERILSRVHDGHINISESGRWFDSGLDASYERVVEELDAAGIDRAALLAMPGVCTNSIFSSGKVNRNKFWCVGNLDFSNINYSIDQIVDLDLDGVKIHPRFQRVGIDALLEMEFMDKLEQLALPVMICGWQQSSTVSIESLSPLHIDKMAKKHPRLPIILSHLGGYRFWDAYTVARANPLVFLDCSYYLQAFRGTSLESDFFSLLKTVDRKVIYGSDFPEVSVRSYLEDFVQNTKGLDDAKMGNILYGNLEALMGRSRRES